ncbi:hypothetical protein AJ79_09543 [Helicocarpus griseus UAMH5409]|uniref:Uncharacterized protein n=1 Tax=Helicocarpus griseus UAMH5409 TaxID=1447875 RepID=A0A2B7WAJ3_9EURO|nr:hypothetical protein AJ79_09543 [Helicocarpus griseus UAMH5409]
MNELVRVGNVPPSIFAERTFKTVLEYFQELAPQQFLHLKYQRNDAIRDENDCQKKALFIFTVIISALQMSLSLKTWQSLGSLTGGTPMLRQPNSPTLQLGGFYLKVRRHGSLT